MATEEGPEETTVSDRGMETVPADLRRQLGKAARTKMEKEFDLATQIQKLERHYDDIQERRRSR